MAILKVSILGNPVLRKIARPVAMKDIRSRKFQALIDSMIETMTKYNGVGIAAPQVNVSKQIVVFRVRNNPRYPDAPRIPLTVLINPRITPLSAEMESDFEGCLSVPGYWGEIKRSLKVTVKGLDRSRREVRVRGAGLLAQALEHEIDHLNGVLYIDHLESLDELYEIEVETETPEI